MIPARPPSESDSRSAEKLARELGIVKSFLDDPTALNIVLNPDGRLWVERVDQPYAHAGDMSPPQAEAIMMTLASMFKTTITRENPLIECELPFDGSRFAGAIPPVSIAPVFAIRRHAVRVYTLSDYVADGVMTEYQSKVIRSAVEQRDNVLVVGGPGAGKTTLTNAIIAHISEAQPDHRLIVVEDTAELQVSSPNAVMLRTTETVDMARLLGRLTLRFDPDRIIVGEVRGREAHALLKAWNTGNRGGIATIHADNAASIFLRFEELVAEATAAPQQAAIARALGLVVFIESTPRGRRVTELLQVIGHDGTNYITHHHGDTKK